MKLLIGYDGSSYADAAIDDLRRAGLPNEVEALVVSVEYAPTISALADRKGIRKRQVVERVVSIVEHANNQLSEALREANELAFKASEHLKSYFPHWQVRSEALAGTPASELMRRADEWRADLVTVGCQGRSAIGRFILGSVSLEVALESPCSVRIARARAAKSDHKQPRILIGLDGSLGSERAVRTVLMRSWPQGTELRIVAVEDGISLIRVAEVVATTGRQVREDMSLTSSRMTKLAAARGLNISAGIKKGEPQSVLIAEAREWAADCIFVGASGFNNNSKGSSRDSVSMGLAANAECSIEIVR